MNNWTPNCIVNLKFSVRPSNLFSGCALHCKQYNCSLQIKPNNSSWRIFDVDMSMKWMIKIKNVLVTTDQEKTKRSGGGPASASVKVFKFFFTKMWHLWHVTTPHTSVHMHRTKMFWVTCWTILYTFDQNIVPVWMYVQIGFWSFWSTSYHYFPLATTAHHNFAKVPLSWCRVLTGQSGLACLSGSGWHMRHHQQWALIQCYLCSRKLFVL